MSELGVWIALSAGVKTRALFQIWFHGPLYSGFVLIDPISVLDAVVVHDREAVDIGLLGDGAGLRRTDAGLGVDCREMQRGEHGNPADKASSCDAFHDSKTFHFATRCRTCCST